MNNEYFDLRTILFGAVIGLMLGVIVTILSLEHGNRILPKDTKLVPARVYQIEIESQDTCALYNGNKLIGKFFLTDDSEIGNLIIYDQE